MEIAPLRALETPLSEFEKLTLLDAIVLLSELETPVTFTKALLTAFERLVPCAARLDASAFETPVVWLEMLVLRVFVSPLT